MIPCSCCDAEASHRGSDGFFRCEQHRLNSELASFDTMNVDSMRDKIEGMSLAIRFGGCSAVHAEVLRNLGGGWAVDAQREIDGLRAKLARLAQAANDYRLHYALDGKSTAAALDEALASARE